MPKYNVHIFPVFRITVKGVEAESVAEAAKKAEDHLFDETNFLRRYSDDDGADDQATFSEDIHSFIVDPVLEDGGIDYEKSAFLNSDYGFYSWDLKDLQDQLRVEAQKLVAPHSGKSTATERFDEILDQIGNPESSFNIALKKLNEAIEYSKPPFIPTTTEEPHET